MYKVFMLLQRFLLFTLLMTTGIIIQPACEPMFHFTCKDIQIVYRNRSNPSKNEEVFAKSGVNISAVQHAALL